ncbi:hypothetical protein GQ853_24400 [Vibrio parahaemolyticus]|nr:hypothetical protein [Vibrio parahaemolyticus]EHR1005943.1 hypothetical protein [Vibrio parahaemolyticus]EIU6865498.1 hypothetical protein [Vibrio parahaemolyticus]EIU7066044.1 hypothetical protein [Vibrio parahaemolyticus]ELB2132550.1 hypothetical protein [Vibrio parahaemolyticus]
MKKRNNKSQRKLYPKTSNKIELVTLFIALWGALLSSWVFVQGQLDKAPKIHISVSAKAVGRSKDNIPVGDVELSITNIGKETITIAPRLLVRAIDAKTLERYEAEAYFNNDAFTLAERLHAPIPKTLKVGEVAIAKTTQISGHAFFRLIGVQSVMFEVASGERFSFPITSGSKYSISTDPNNNETVGWTSSGLASEL